MTRKTLKLLFAAIFLLTTAAATISWSTPPPPAMLRSAERGMPLSAAETISVTPDKTLVVPSPPISSALETPTFVLSATLTVSPQPSPTLTPSATLPLSPASTAAPTPTPILTASPTPTPTPLPGAGIIEWARKHILTVVVAGLLLMLLVVGLALLVIGLLRRQRPPLPLPPSPPPGPPGPCLVRTDVKGRTLHFPLHPESSTIGRGKQNTIVIDEDVPGADSVSRRHAVILQKEGRWIVADLSSTNGVYVNGQRTGRNLLRDGDRLSFGSVEFIFRIGVGEAEQ